MIKKTSREIAKLAGVSVSTVSLVLNNKPGVGEETRKRIMDILNAYGIFSKTANSSSGREVIRFCKIVRHGQIINDRHNMFISEYIDGVVEEAKLFNLSVEVATYENIKIGEIAQEIDRFSEKAGSILLCTELSEQEITLFETLKTPHVFLDANYPTAKGSFVTMDNERMVFEAMQYLSNAGHQRIGMFTSHGCSNFTSRQNAYIASLKKLSLETYKNYLIPVHSTHQGSYEDVSAFLSLRHGGTLPTAFFACNDIVASGAIRALQDMGYRVPEDISIVGFDDLPISSLLTPSLTTLSVPKVELGRVAVRVLLNEWDTDCHITSQKSLLGGKLIQRASVRNIL